MDTRSDNSALYIVPVCLTAFFIIVAGSVLGLSMTDDSHYMQNAVLLKAATFARYRDWAPLYTAWFQLLGIVCRNPIARYFLSWGLLVALLGLTPTALKTRSAWLYTLIVLATPIFTIWPFVSLLAAVIVLISMCLLLRQPRSFSVSTTAACGTCFLLSLVRPEFGYGVYVAALASLAALLWEARNRSHLKEPVASHHGTFAAVALGTSSILLAALTRLLQSLHGGDVSRSGMAFAQHFTLRAIERGALPNGTDNWRSDYPERIFGIDISHSPVNGTATIGDFFHANPHLFFSHVSHNLADPRFLFSFLLLACVAFWPWFAERARHLRAASVFLCLVALPTIASMLLIYPRTHYAVVIFPALTIYALQLTSPLAWRPAFFLWILAPTCVSIWVLNVGRLIRANPPTSVDLTTLRQVQCVYELDQTVSRDNAHVFAATPLLPVYLPRLRDVQYPEVLHTWTDFKYWNTNVRPAWISTDAALARQYGITPNELDRFLHDDLGYTPHACPIEARLTVYTNDQVAH